MKKDAVSRELPAGAQNVERAFFTACPDNLVFTIELLRIIMEATLMKSGRLEFLILLRQAVDICCYQMRLILTEKFLVGGHDTFAPPGNRLGNLLWVTTIQPDIIC